MLIQNIKVAADSLIFYRSGSDLQLLLIRRGNEPFKGMWAFPGGFVDDVEDLEPAAIRELHEETGLKLPSLKQLHTFGKPGRDPRGRTISVVYYAVIGNKPAVAGGDDAAEAHWVSIQDIAEMAFDHMMVLEFALQALKDELK